MEEYSKRLGSISAEQFAAALHRFQLGEFVRAERVPYGLFGQNVFLTSTCGEFVLRGVPHYPWQFPAEQFFVNQLHAHTEAPVPYPYLLDPTTDIFGWNYVIMPRLPGIQPQDPQIAAQLSFADQLGIARALARALAQAQQLAAVAPGQFNLDSGSVKPLPLPYRDWIVEHIREKVAAARGYNQHTTPADVEWIESILAATQSVRDTPYIPCIVLGDYGEHNAVFVRDGKEWQVSGIFDLMTAHNGDGQADLSVSITIYLRKDKRLADAFVQEYLLYKAMPPGFAAQQQFYMLDLMLSFWRHWQRNEGRIPGESDDLTFEAYARPCVDYWTQWR